MSRARDLSRLSNSQAFSVDSNFNVGINTDNPQVELDVSGNANISGNISVGGTITYDDVTNIDSIGIITARSDVSIADRIIHTGDTDTTIRFPADDTITVETAGFERVRIDNSGRVGVGTISPGYRLDVKSPGNGQFFINGQNSSGTDIFQVYESSTVDGQNGMLYLFDGAGNNDVKLSTNGNSWFNAGNFGIGTASPEDSLHIKSNSGAIRLENTVVSNNDSTIAYDNTDLAFHVDPNNVRGSSNITFSGDGNERMRIDSFGNVGIGTMSPARKLVVTGDTNTVAAIQGTTDGTSSLFLGDTADEDIGALTYNHALNHLEVTVNASERMRIDSSGRVGIGTVSPQRDLHLNRSDSDTLQIHLTNSTTGATANDGFSIALGSDESAILNQRESNNMLFKTADTERMRIDSSGRLLVGTSSSLHQNAQLQTAGTGYFGYNHFQFSNDAFAPTVSLKKSRGASVGTNTIVQNGDRLGTYSFFGADGSSFIAGADITAFVDGTPGAADMPGRLVFSTTADGASSPTERMRITSAGSVQAGDPATNGGWNLLVNDNGQAGQRGRMLFRAKSGGYSLNEILQIYLGTAEQLRITANGNITNANNSYGSLSDAKLKENIVDASSQWDDIKDLRVRNYNLIEGETHTQIGVVAQEVEDVSPGLVTESPDIDDEGNDLGTTTKSVNYSVLYMKAVKALQEAMDRIETLETQNTDLLARITALETN